MRAAYNATRNFSWSGGGCEPPRSTSFLVSCAMLLLLGLLIIIANLNVIVMVCCRRRLKSPVNLCLASLAGSDLLAGVFALPLIVACSTVCRVPELCLAMDLFQRSLAMSTIIHILVITTERYVLIVYPMAYPRVVTRPRVSAALLGTWITSSALSLIQLCWSNMSTTSQTRAQRLRLNLVYDYICFSIFVLLPLAFIIYAHVRILLVSKRHAQLIRRQSRHMCARSRQRKGTLVHLAMIGVFVVGWFPYFFLTIEHDSSHVSLVLPPWAFTVLLFMKASTALLNPLLYTYFNRDFRREVKTLFCRWHRCTDSRALLTTGTDDVNKAVVTKRKYSIGKATIFFESAV